MKFFILDEWLQQIRQYSRAARFNLGLATVDRLKQDSIEDIEL